MPQGPNAKYVHKDLRPKSMFAKGSYRTIAIGGDKKMIVGCPKGHWDGRRCGVGMKGKTMLLPNYPNNPGRKMKKRKSKWTVATAPRRVRLMWLAKAQRARKYYARCRARMGLGRHARKAPIVLRGPRTPYTPPVLTPSDTWEGEVEKPVEQVFGPANWLRKNPADGFGYRGSTGGLSDSVSPGARVTFVDHDGKLRSGRAVMRSSSGGWVLNMGGRYGTPAVVDDSNITKVSSPRSRSRNPELLVVSNNPDGRSKSMRRRRRRNTAGRKYPKGMWKKLVKKYGVKGAKRHMGGGTKRRRRRSRRRNTWFGHRRGHAVAARKGWRHRRRRGAKSRRRGRKARGRRRGGRRGSRRATRGKIKYGRKFYSPKTLRNKIGKRRFEKLCKKRGRRANSRRRRFRRRN
jgi:hypothetical protein